MIAEPDQVIFDEVHFGNFSSWYIKNEFHFDIHPPLGKMIMAGIAKATQYKGDIEYASKFGEPYGINELFYVSQRITPAIFSAMTSPLLFAAARCLSLSTFSSAMIGLILTSDISLIVEGKFILSDGILHFFVALHIFALCHFLVRPTFINTLIDGITLGCAFSCKYTALGLLAVDGITQIVWIFRTFPSIVSIIKRALSLLVPAFSVLYGVWVIHFIITPYTGYNSFYLQQQHQHTIFDRQKLNYTYWGDRMIRSPLIIRILNWNEVMNGVNMRSAIPHISESQPINWPLFMDRWVFFYSDNVSREINCMANPLLYWFVFIGIVLTVILAPFRVPDYRNALFTWGWAVSYFPFILVPRTMFLYHYLIPLMFGIMNLVTILDNMFSMKHKYGVIAAVALVCFLSYAFFSPMAYGTPCPDCKYSRVWTDRWRQGPPKPMNLYGVEMFNTTEKLRQLPL
ncbi:Dolichyl-phosphate-mannose-protein mannosyltransferase [Histomonas meleagridis]|uniref:Dolichyl-phosphate-mannose-protein mannosyltransferase n=1 Tax=Histomonas meleagridis TaxID=135588 RepID=UPI0035599A80|nr:Dolichyl-phosphate-mannose-protein mannosyltransferase [Histomonas meleagridis]KAH0799201.1 Dolichyl-phosphate-mannose-protein mannosyltransferase [Histomonas meleagridis]